MNHRWTRAALLGSSMTVAVAYFSFNYLPAKASFASQHVLIDQREKLVTHATSIPMQVTNVKRQLESTKEFCLQWRSRLVGEDQLPTQFNLIVQAAERHDVHVVDFNPGERTRISNLTRVPLKLTVEASYPQLVSFLADVEHHRSIIWVEQADITATQANQETLSCKVTFVVFARNSEYSDDVKHAPHPIP